MSKHICFSDHLKLNISFQYYFGVLEVWSESEMGYEEAWKVLADLFVDLREKGETIPDDIMEDLRSAKTLTNLLGIDPEHVESLTKIETFLNNVESYLISVAQNSLGTEYAEIWMKKLEEAQMKIPEKKEVKTVKPVTGIPKGNKWVRVQLSEDVTEEYVKKLAKENNLSIRIEEDGYSVVYGDDEKLKALVAQMRQNVKERKKQ